MSDIFVKTYVSISRLISDTMTELLETKHLYQSVSINENKLKMIFNDESNADVKERYPSSLSFVGGQWYFTSGEENFISNKISSLDLLTIYIMRIHVFCSNCKKIVPMNLVNSNDTLIGISKNNLSLYKTGIQLFCLNFLCQSCRIPSDTFLVYRNQVKLLLCGRNPMEIVITPRDIPKNVKKYYSDAIIANNSGKNLAGLFYLRTLIEQYLRSKYQLKDEYIDNLIEKYMEDLPEDYKQRHPSIKELYSNLSVAIHKAEESNELFEETIEKINLHFEAKRIYKIE